MEDLFGVIVIFAGIIASIISSAKKEKAKTAAMEKHKAATAARLQAAQEKMNAAAKPAPPPQPVAFADVPGQVIAPTVHPHVQPECETHDAPGSLGVTSMEGKDPCHEDELTLTRSFDEAPTQPRGLTFDWTGDSLVKAVVMQEVLTRPAQRAR